MLKQSNILVAGAGNMASALIKGWQTANLVPAEKVSVLNRSNGEKLRRLVETYGVVPAEDKIQAVKDCDILVLAVKPQDAVSFLHSIQEFLHEQQILISVAAGISTQIIEEAIDKRLSVVRAMPNTGAAVLESATAVSYGKYCTDTAKEVAGLLLGAVGSLAVVEEFLMDAVTGLAGSGPAYFYYMVEAMQAAGRSLGIPPEVSDQLVVQTLYGAGKMLKEGNLSAAELRRQVTSPNGTTAAGLQVLESEQLTEIMMKAVIRAKERGAEMGREVYDGTHSTRLH